LGRGRGRGRGLPGYDLRPNTSAETPGRAEAAAAGINCDWNCL
jgi:hypothetical protein